MSDLVSEMIIANENRNTPVLNGSWNVLIVDDEVNVHEMTGLVLNEFVYANKNLSFTSAYSAKEAISILKNNQSFHLVLLDIIMENSLAGLEVVEYIRKTLHNRLIRIIIRSGESGEFNQRYIVDNYDINDYRAKAELTMDQFYTSIRTALVQVEQFEELNSTKNELIELNTDLQIQIDEAVKVQKQVNCEEFQHNRITQMNELLNMLAHQWRQPLSRIATVVANMKLHIALETYDINSMGHELDKVDSHIQELSDTINSFRKLYKIDDGHRINNIDKSLLETIELMKPLLDDDSITLSVDIPFELPSISTEIAQVFLNLIKNAYEEFISRETKNPHLSIAVYYQENRLFIDFKDNAGGIENEILEKVFDPYFSTKLKRHGIGLGLFSCKTIIEQTCFGSLECFNEDKGACFRIKIPMNHLFNSFES